MDNLTAGPRDPNDQKQQFQWVKENLEALASMSHYHNYTAHTVTGLQKKMYKVLSTQKAVLVTVERMAKQMNALAENANVNVGDLRTTRPKISEEHTEDSEHVKRRGDELVADVVSYIYGLLIALQEILIVMGNVTS